MGGLANSQSVSFRQGTNVEFGPTAFGNGPGTGVRTIFVIVFCFSMMFILIVFKSIRPKWVEKSLDYFYSRARSFSGWKYGMIDISIVYIEYA